MKKFLLILLAVFLITSCEKAGEVEDMMSRLVGEYTALPPAPEFFQFIPDSKYDAKVYESDGKWYFDRYLLREKSTVGVVLQNEITWNKALGIYLLEQVDMKLLEQPYDVLENPLVTYDPDQRMLTVSGFRFIKK